MALGSRRSPSRLTKNDIMKTLLILRHAKAEHFNEDGDKARRLTERGQKDAEHVGEMIAEKFGVVGVVISSDAVRASQTAQIAAQAEEYDDVIVLHPEMYGANVETLFEVVRTIPEDIDSALVVGHNPALEEFCADLCDQPVTNSGLPTCGFAHIELPDGWTSAEQSIGTLKSVWTPK
jgi:phosphohistidine phosphatase